MEKLTVEKTKSTPEVSFDPESNVLSINGQSYPENAFKFYEPIMKWIDDYLEQLQDGTGVKVELCLPYINTSSTKCFMMLLEKLDEAFQEGADIKLDWYCNEENESEIESAEEFKEDLTLPVNIISRADA
jgi:hypothetical protein